MKRPVVFLLLILILCIDNSAFSQNTDSSRRQALLHSAIDNLATLRDYQWTMKAELSTKDKKFPTQLFNIKWGKDGSILISEKAGAAPIGDDADSKLVQTIAALVAKYTGPTDKKLTAFFEAANMESDSGNMIELSGGDYMVTEDKVTMDVDKIIYMIRGVTFTTVVDENDVMGTIEYAVDNNAMKYPARVKVDIPAKRMSVVFTNSEFINRQ